MSFGKAVLYSVLGLLVVFFALILLMLMTKLMAKIIPAEEEKAAAPKESPKPAPEKASGSAGEIKLNGVDPRDAAMCMAIVADKLGKPINELRFISIKEVEE